MLTIIIPTYNERDNIRALFERIKKSLKNFDYEIIIADSNSNDGTQEEVRKVAAELQLPVKLINTGKADLSNSVVIGIKKARGDLICVMDADLQHPPEKIPEMLKEINKGADFVNASRYLPESKIDFSIGRRVLSKAFQFMAKILVPSSKQLTDVASGFFIFKKKIISNKKLEPIGYKIMLEILAKGDINKISEIPYHFKERTKGTTKLNYKQILLGLIHLFRLSKLEYSRWIKFILVGFSGLIINESILYFLTEHGLFYLFSSIIAIEISIITNFILNYTFTFSDHLKEKFLLKLIKFNIARVFGGGINLFFLWFLTALGMHYLISNLIGIFMATIVNYIASTLWVWKEKYEKN